MVEQNNGGSYTEIAYALTGEKLALMSGQSLQKAFVSLAGGAEITQEGETGCRNPTVFRVRWLTLVFFVRFTLTETIHPP